MLVLFAERWMSGAVTRHRTVQIAGRERDWLEVRPAADPLEATRLLIAVHGSNQTPASFRRASSRAFEHDSPDGEPTVVVYPASWKRGLWNDARISTHSRARDEGIDDVAFLRSLAAVYRREGVQQVHAAGFSNGGQMLIRMIRDTDDVIDAAAIISATVPADENLSAPALNVPHPIPVLLVHGTADGVVPYGGGVASLYGIRPRGEMRSFTESVELWRDAARITAEPEQDVLRSRRRPGATSIRWRYRQQGHPALTAIAIGGGGHWMPRDIRRPALLGRVGDEIDLLTEMKQTFDSV